MMGSHATGTAWHDRSEPRDEVLYRARATGPDGRHLSVTIVNLSPHGMMLRCERDYPAGARLNVALLGLGLVGAEIRWSLGGRMGCQLDQAIPPTQYHRMIALMTVARAA